MTDREDDDAQTPADEIDEAGYDALLAFLQKRRGFDFTSYKRTGLARRIKKRMLAVDVTDFATYIDYLDARPEEFPRLFDAILINVTSFFRDQSTWDQLAIAVVPELVRERGDDGAIRIWSAGCATGQEPYSLAMLLAEAMPIQAFGRRVKIYATDVDGDALAAARQAAYGAREVESVPEALRERYFVRSGRSYKVHRALRNAVIFGRHDLLQDAPISRVDLLVCRNTLMYFNADAQDRILKRFHFALAEQGTLFLGRAEMIFGHAALFAPLDGTRRLFTRAGKPSHLRDAVVPSEPPPAPDIAGELRCAAFEAGCTPAIVIDTKQKLVCANERARSLLGVRALDVGRPVDELEIARRPVELQAALRESSATRRAITITSPELDDSAETGANVDVTLVPLFTGGAFVGSLASFTDTSRTQKLQAELHKAAADVEAAYEELESSSEVLETTNEELQSTVEELETANEELEAANEELETTNEELQSTIDELHAANAELRRTSSDLAVANGFSSAILSSLGMALIAVNRELAVQVWNAKAEELLGVGEAEARGAHLFNLELGLRVDLLKGPIRECFAGVRDRSEIVVQMNHHGRAARCRVTIQKLTDPTGVPGLILLMEEVPA